MAVLDITHYDRLARDGTNNIVPVGIEPALSNQQVAIGGSSTQSAAIPESTKFIRVHTDVACRIAFGTNPTASATSKRMAANATEYFGIVPGVKIAVITTT